MDEYTYTHDRAGTVHSRTNGTQTNGLLDEVYDYNNLDELTSTMRGGSAYQSWDLDAAGNWGTFTDAATVHSKTFDAANQETGSTASATSQYDAAGNAIVTAQPQGKKGSELLLLLFLTRPFEGAREDESSDR